MGGWVGWVGGREDLLLEPPALRGSLGTGVGKKGKGILFYCMQKSRRLGWVGGKYRETRRRAYKMEERRPHPPTHPPTHLPTFPRNGEVRRAFLRTHAHVLVVIRVPQPIVNHPIHQLPVTQAVARTSLLFGVEVGGWVGGLYALFHSFTSLFYVPWANSTGYWTCSPCLLFVFFCG